MATIAELMVKIDANNKGLNRALQQSESRVKKFGKSVKRALGVAFKAGLAAAAVGLAALTAGIARASEEVDKLAKTSAKLGIATEELQKMQLQAKLSGVSTETLNMALQRMVRRVAEAAQGTGEAVKALQELGLDAKQLNQLSPDKQFQKVAEAMKKVGNQSDKVRLAMKLFDSEGVALVNTLGSDLDGVAKKFDDLGLGISKSQAAAIESMNDSRTILSTIFDDVSAKVLAELAPAFQSLTDGVIAWIKEMGGAGEVAKKIAGFIVTGFKGVKMVIDTVAMAFKGWSMIIQGLQPIAATVFEYMGQALQKLRSLTTDLIEKIATAIQKMNSLRQKATTAALDLLPSLQYDPNADGKPTASGIAAAKSRMETQKAVNKIQVEILADKNGLVNAVISDEEYRKSIDAVAAKVMKDSARATRR